MRNKKILILIIFCLLLSGCSVNYKLEIKNDTIKESITSISTSKTERFLEETICDNYKYQDNIYTPSLNKNNVVINNYAKKHEGVEYYDTRYSDSNNNCRINGDYTYDIYEYGSAYSIPQYVKNFKAYQEDGEYIIKASNFKFFKDYNTVQEFDVTINTNYEVTYNNADKTNGNNYIWHIDRTNFGTKQIEFRIKYGKTNEAKTEENKLTLEAKIKDNIIYIIGGATFLLAGIIAFVITSKKQNKY